MKDVSPMRILIITPTALPRVSGNAQTAERWRKHLALLGLHVSVLEASRVNSTSARAVLEELRPDLVHIHHLYKGARGLFSEKGFLLEGIPLVVSPGGTDLHQDVDEEGRRELIRELMEKASFIVVQEPEMMGKVRRLWPHLGSKTVFVPKGVHFLGDGRFPLRERLGAGQDHFVFFLPSGVRPVKGNLEWLRSMDRVYRLRPHVRVALAGPVLDIHYYGHLQKELARSEEFARYLGTIPPSSMRGAYMEANVVVSASISEGLSNALLEAASLGIPLLATDVPGNRYALLGEGGEERCGLLYDRDDPEDLVRKALALIDHEGLREELSRAGKAKIERYHNPLEEARLLKGLYEKAVD
jgi:glycosyltransferase involved in cell wall biosynthesis